MTSVEICVADATGVVAARNGGADRIELCAALEIGGLTPSIGLVTAALELAGPVSVTVLVRPRAGDFHYGTDEIDVMVADILALADLAAARQRAGVPARLEVTTGALTAAGDLDLTALRRLRDAAGPLPVVQHKAFDLVADPASALDQLADLGIGATLTSGGGGPARDNLEILRRLVARRDDVVVVPAGGVRAHDVATLVQATGARRVHLRAPRPLPQSTGAGGEYRAAVETTDTAEVAAVVAAVAAVGGQYASLVRGDA
ncbi:copper homeostasis protein CutC [Occultella kanbiaonis]|uniref:copper homeostasis protein CutC n=1 Tax=Occultella kanbiaonis TaxID=2675754 RepID=UPI0013D3D678|nr:copper homeostasis protein CutC [Occultella kanbiaonis]